MKENSGSPYLRPAPKKRIPFEFVIDALAGKDPAVRAMFGCYGVYVEGKIVFALRDRDAHPGSNGVWIATSHEHHDSLRKDFPSLRSIGVLGRGITGWQMLPVSDDDFERSVLKACACVLQGDPRIGKIPKAGRG